MSTASLAAVHNAVNWPVSLGATNYGYPTAYRLPAAFAHKCLADTHATRCLVPHRHRHGTPAYENDSMQTRIDTEPLVYSFNSASAAYMPDFGKRFNFELMCTSPRFLDIDIAEY